MTTFDPVNSLYSLTDGIETGAYDVSPLTIAKTFSVTNPNNPKTLSIKSPFISGAKTQTILNELIPYVQTIENDMLLRNKLSIKGAFSKTKHTLKYLSEWKESKEKAIDPSDLLKTFGAYKEKYLKDVARIESEINGLERTRVHKPSVDIDNKIQSMKRHLQDAKENYIRKERLYTEKSVLMKQFQDGYNTLRKSSNEQFYNLPLGKEYIQYAHSRLTRNINQMTNDVKNGEILANIIKDIDISLSDYTEFKTSGSFAIALNQVEDTQVKNIMASIYKKGVDNNGRVVFRKTGFLADYNTHIGSNKQVYIPGVYDMDGIDQSNVEKWFKVISTNEAANNVYSSAGSDNTTTIRKLSNLIEGYQQAQNEMDIEEKAQYILSDKQSAKGATDEVTNVIKEVKYVKKEDKIRKSSGNPTMITNNEIRKLVSDGVIDEKTAIELQSDMVSKLTPNSSMPQHAEAIYSKLDEEFFAELNKIPELPTTVTTNVDSFNLHYNTLSYLNNSPAPVVDSNSIPAIKEKYGENFDFAGANKETQDDIIKMAKEYHINKANEAMTDINFALKSIGPSDKDVQRAYLSDLASIEFEERVEWESYNSNNREKAGTFFEKFDDQYEQNTIERKGLESNTRQAHTTQKVLNEATDKRIIDVRQRDTEVVKLGISKTHDVVEMISIGRPISRTDLENNFVNYHGKPYMLEAVDEYTSLIEMKHIRDFGVDQPAFTPAEWLDQKVKFGDYEYDITKFKEYYNIENRKKQAAMLRMLPNSPEVVTRESIENMINGRLKEYVALSTENVQYPIRKKVNIDAVAYMSHAKRIEPILEEALSIAELLQSGKSTRNIEEQLSLNTFKKMSHYRDIFSQMKETGNDRYNGLYDIYKDTELGKIIDTLDSKFEKVEQQITSLSDINDPIEKLKAYKKISTNAFKGKRIKNLQVNYDRVFNYQGHYKLPVPKTKTVKETMDIPLFREEWVPLEKSKRRKTKLSKIKSIDPNNMIIDMDNEGNVVRGEITLNNYKEVFKRYGVSTDGIKDIEELIEAYDSAMPVWELTSSDKQKLIEVAKFNEVKEQIKQNQEVAKTKGKLPPKNLVVVKKPVSKDVTEKLEESIKHGTKLQRKGDIVGYKALGLNDTHAILEADHINVNNIMLDIKYTGDRTTAEIIKELEDKQHKLSDFPMSIDDIIDTKQEGKVIYRAGQPLFVGVSDDVKVGLNREEIINRLMKKNKNVDVEGTKYSSNVPDLLRQVIGANWSWMLDDQDIENRSISALYDAVYQIDPLDISTAASDLGLDFSNPMSIPREEMDKAVDRAVAQKAKGILIKDWMSDSKGAGREGAEVRVARKILESQGIINPTSDDIHSTLKAVQKDIEGSDLNYFYKEIDKLVKNKKLITEQIGQGKEISLEDYLLKQQKTLEEVDVFDAIGDRTPKTYSDIERYLSTTGVPAQNRAELFENELKRVVRKELKQGPLSKNEILAAKMNARFSEPDGRKAAQMKETTKILVTQLSSQEHFAILNKEENLKIIQEEVLAHKKHLRALPEIITNMVAQKFKNDKEYQFKTLSRIHSNKGISNTLDAIASIGDERIKRIIMSQLKDNVAEEGYDYVMRNVRISKNSKTNAPTMNKRVYKNIEKYLKEDGSIKKVISAAMQSPLKQGMFGLFGNDISHTLEGLNAKGLHANNTETLQMFQMLQDIVGKENLSITGRAVTSNGRVSTFAYSDKYEGVIVDNDGGAYRLVTHKDEAIDTPALAYLKRGDIDYKKTTPTLEQMSSPIILPRNKTSFNFTMSSLMDYDDMTYRTYTDMGILDPKSMLDNYKKVINKNGASVGIYDLETTGLLGQIDDTLFRPVEFSFMPTVMNNGELVPSGKIERYFVKPTKKVEKALTEAITPESKGQYISQIDELIKYAINPESKEYTLGVAFGKDDATFGLVRNYAKYAKETGELWTNNIRVTNSGAVEVLDNSGQMLKSFTSSVAYVEAITQDAKKVTNYLLSKTTGDGVNINVPKENIVSFAESLPIMMKKLNEVEFGLGHNNNSADNTWLRTWKKTLIDSGEISQSDAGTLLSTKFLGNTIDTLELFKVAQPGRENYKLDQTIKNGQAHLADVDIEGTRQLFNSFYGNKRLQATVDDLTMVEKGSIFVKDGVDRVGIKNMDKGVYRFNGITTVNKVVDDKNNRHINQTMLLVDKLLPDGKSESLEIPFQNNASLIREASRNWVPFDNEESARIFFNKKVATDKNRTLANAFDYETWNDYLGKGKGMQKDIEEGLTKLGNELTESLLEKRKGEVQHSILSSENWTDAQLLALANKDKVYGEGLQKEIRRIRDVRSDRLPEYQAFADFAESAEGKLVRDYLYEGDVRKRVWGYRADKSLFGKYNKQIHSAVHEVRQELINGGLLDAQEYMFEIPNKKRLLTIPEDALATMLDGYETKGMGNINIDIDITNRKSINDDLHGLVKKLTYQLHNLNPNKGDNFDKTRGTIINDIIMPALSAQYSGTSIIQEDLSEAINAIYHNRHLETGSQAIDVNENLQKTMKVLISNIAEASKNKDELLTNLETVREVNMYKVIPENSEAWVQGSVMLENKLKIALGELDENLATVQRIQNGEIQYVVDENLRIAQNHLVELKKTNDAEYRRIIQEVTGTDKPDVILAHLNTNRETKLVKNAPHITKVISAVDTNPRRAEYATYSAKQLMDMADELIANTYVPTHESIENLLRTAVNKGEVTSSIVGQNTDFIKYMHEINNGSWASKGGYVDEINFKIKRRYNPQEMNSIVNSYMGSRNIIATKEHIKKNYQKRADILKTLADRAYAIDHQHRGLTGVIPEEVIKGNRIKYEAMEAIGLIQEHNGAKYTGQIGLPGKYKAGIELDPAKIIIGSSYRESNYKDSMSLADLTYEELEAIKNNNMANKKHRSMASRYLHRLNMAFEETGDIVSAKNAYNEGATIRYIAKLEAKRTIESNAITNATNEKESVLKALNEKITEKGMKAQEIERVTPQLHSAVEGNFKSIEDNTTYRKIVDSTDDFMDKSRSVIKDVLGSKVVRYSILAGAGALALNAIHNYTSSGRMPEQQPQGDVAPMVDGNYERAYNGREHKHINMPKTVRLEENGTGMTINVNARNNNRVQRADISDAVSNTLSTTMNADVNFRYSDDTSTINQDYVQGLFSDALR